MKQRLAHLDRISHLWENIRASLSEKDRRLWAAQHAKEIGHGGAPLVSQATGLSLSTLRRGLKELQNPQEPSSRIRKPGGGAKNINQTLPHLHLVLQSLMRPERTVCESPPFVWTLCDTSTLAQMLTEENCSVSANTVSRILREHNYHVRPLYQPYSYTYRGDVQTQCRYIYLAAVKAQKQQLPFLFVDVKEHPLDDFLLKQAPPTSCLFPCEDISHHKGWAFAGVKDHNTAWVLQALQTWWKDIGCGSYRGAEVITLVTHGYNKEIKSEGLMDACPWQQALQQLAYDSGLSIRVRHLPPCTFRWNNILHKTTTYSVCEGKILAVTLYAIGLSGNSYAVSSYWDSRQPPALLSTNKINIKRDKFHPEWNYVVYRKEKI